MNINRRSFIISSLVGLVGSQIPIEIPSNPPFFNYVPHPAQLKFFSQPDIPMMLYGVPYHQSTGTTGEWLGIKRS